MTWVWDNAEVSGADLLLLLAIADYCNEEGECYPSVKRLAKMARISESHAQTLLRKMKDAKDISVVLNAGIETGRGATNRYYINGYRQAHNLPFIASTSTVRKPDELKKPRKKSWGIADNTPTVSSTPTGIADNTSGVLPIVPKPSVEPPVEPLEYKDIPSSNGRLLKEKASKPYYDTILGAFNIHGGQNTDMQKMLEGVSKKNGYQEYNLNPPVSLEEFQSWVIWAKNKLGQYMVKSPAKVNGSIIEWRLMLSKAKPLGDGYRIIESKPNPAEATERAIAKLMRGEQP